MTMQTDSQTDTGMHEDIYIYGKVKGVVFIIGLELNGYSSECVSECFPRTAC